MFRKDYLKYCKFYDGGGFPTKNPRVLIPMVTEDGTPFLNSDGKQRFRGVGSFAACEYCATHPNEQDLVVWNNCDRPGEYSGLPEEFLASFFARYLYKADDLEGAIWAFIHHNFPTYLNYQP